MKNANAQLVNTVLFLHGLVILVLIAWFGKFLFIPLFFSFLIAVFLYPLSRWLERKNMHRVLASFVCILIALSCCAIIVYFVGAQFHKFLKDVPALKDKFSLLVKNVQMWLQQHYHIDEEAQADYLDKSADNLVNAVGFTLSSSLAVVLFITLSIFFTFYILVYRQVLKNFIQFFFNNSQKKKVAEIAVTLNDTISNYIKGLLTEMGILIFLSSIVLLILGIKYAILMAFLAGIFNIIPYIGIYTATLFNMIITLTNGSGKQSLEVLLVFVIIHIIDANIITPFIVGSRIKINPLATLIAVICGELIWGIPGMFLFIPLAAILKVILEKSTSFDGDKI